LRIAYVVGWPGGHHTGPFKKVVEQSAAWRAFGHEVGLFVLTESPHADEWSQLPGVQQVTCRAPGVAALFRQKERLVSSVLRWGPDVAYHRYALPYPGMLRMARRLPLVLEINTDDLAEYDLLSPLKGKVNRLTRGQVLRRVAGLVVTTRELAQSPIFARYARPSLVLANGISLASVHPSPAPENSGPRLVFLGQPGCPWHGLDKLAALARARPGWHLDVVGPDRSEVPDPPTNLAVHGSLSVEQYRPILARADIGVGTLALHRKNMDEASPLKVREYLATGLPVITGYRDTDFPGAPPFLLQLPNTEDNVTSHLAELDAFVDAWQGRRVPRDRLTHLDSLHKESARLAFFSRVAELAGAGGAPAGAN
jgi:hypothetical protein